MNELRVELNNCFGINHFKHDFNFAEKKSVLIYAPNGIMKTSFAKTFKCLSEKKQPNDQVYPKRNSSASVLCDGKTIDPISILVSDAESDININDKVTTLLASKELKAQYDNIYKHLDVSKNSFLKNLKDVARSSDCELEIVTTFKESEKDNLFDCLEKIKDKLKDETTVFSFKYNDIFDKKGNVKKFLDKNKDLIQEYFAEYKSLITSSSFFKDNEDGPAFGTYQARRLIDSVEGDAFFKANHKIVLNNQTELSSYGMLTEVFNNEINRIFADEKLKKVFEKIDNAIGANAELRAFKEAIEKDKSLIPYLTEYDEFRKLVWCGYIYKIKSEYYELLGVYEAKKHDLSRLLEEARRENELWADIINIYKQRFFVPFDVSINNQEDVILKQDAANLVFSYKDSQGEAVQKEKNELLTVLSRGEKRAFFILQLLFEIEARKRNNTRSLIIFDDVADSFDYKNKHAIVEYISELNKTDIFNQIILTHNFDFYRTISSRLDLGSNVFMAIKTDETIRLEKGNYRKDFFRRKLNQVNQPDVFVSLIPFVRNIVDYTEGDNSHNYQSLTSCLHQKDKSATITVNDVWTIYTSTFKTYCPTTPPENTDMNKNIISFIEETAVRIRQTAPIDEIKLENKLVLSICIRLLAEKYIISVLNDEAFLNSITANQTRKLIDEFCSRHKNEKDIISVLDRVNLITPEYIHLNSFMYEPLIDMSVYQLVSLYDDVMSLNNSLLQ